MLTDALDSEEFESLTDPKLGKNYVESEMTCMLEVAAACVRYSSAKRPRMGQVMKGQQKVSYNMLLIVEHTHSFLNNIFLELSRLSGC